MKKTTQNKDTSAEYLADEIKNLMTKNEHTYSPVLLINIVSVSSSGMTRKMDIYLTNEHIERINIEVAALLDINQDKNDHLIIGGCGMDMCYWLVDKISQALNMDMLPYKVL